ncbi:MAG: hypothetical protein KJ626_01275 [Verrucomicrobia bacterium]|nr:hypothetical protein [Verrucomicrobiota bacterium]
MTKTQQLVAMAKDLARESSSFHEVKGPGKGDRAANSFMKELRQRALQRFQHDYSEKQLCEGVKAAVDFYIPEEHTVVEIAMSLRTPLSEFHKDIFKVLLAKDRGEDIRHLVFVSKPGAIKRHEAPASQAVIDWLEKNYSVTVTIEEFD